MKLLVNLCGHDGIISHYNGVGTMLGRYIDTFIKYFENNGYDYHINLFTPEYNEKSFGYSEDVYKKNTRENVSIYQVNNGSDGKINYGTIDNWDLLCKNTASFINDFDLSKFDLVLTIANDTPFANLLSIINDSDNHFKVWIPHSTIKIHEVDSAIIDSEKFFDARLKWEEDAINYINENSNSYLGAIGNFIEKHLEVEYGLDSSKVLNIVNGEILDNMPENEYNFECENLFRSIEHLPRIILSFGRAEAYKNLDAAMELGAVMGINSVVIAQSYFKEQPILDEYRAKAKKYPNSHLFIDPPFDFAKYILTHFEGTIIALIPSKKEIMGLIINEIRKLNRDNILIVSNNIDGLKEQITDGKNGVLVNLDSIKRSSNKISKYLNSLDIRKMNYNSQIVLNEKYNLYKNISVFMDEILERFKHE